MKQADRSLVSAKRKRRCKQPLLESLESRELLAASITEFSILSSGTNPASTQLAVGTGNSLWFNEPAINEVGQFDASSNTVTGSAMLRSAIGGDPPDVTSLGGTAWFSLNTVGQFGMLPTLTSTAQVYGIQYGPPNPSYAPSVGITTLGNEVWTTVPGVNGLEAINGTSPSAATITPYSLAGTAGANITGFNSQITSGSDGNLWFTESGAIGLFNVSSNTVTTLVNLPTSGGTQIPGGISAGPGNTIWFTESVPGTGASAIGVISTTTDQLIAEFATPTGSAPQGITEGPDGNMWFTESGTGAIGMINVNSLTDPTQDALGTSFAIPKQGQTGGVLSNPDPQGIISGPNNSLWFADSSGAIGQVTLSTPDRFMVTAAPPSSDTAGVNFGFVVSDGTSASDVDGGFTGNVTATVFNQAHVQVDTQTVAAHSGVASFTGLTVNAAAPGYTITVSSTASGAPPSITTNAFVVVPAAPTQVIVTSTPPGTLTAGETFNVTVKLEDAFDNVATNYSGMVTAALTSNPGGSTLGGNTNAIVSPTSSTPGFATLTDLWLNKAASNYTLGLAASDGAATSITGISVTPGTATHLLVTSEPPGVIAPGAGFGLTVEVLDQYDNPIPGRGTVSVALANNPGGSVLGGTTSLTVGSTGSATFTGLSLNNPGSGYILTVSAAGLASTVTTTGIDVGTPPPPPPPPPPAPPTITGETAVFTQKTNKKGKKVGKPVFSGYTITFSAAMNTGTLANSGDFVMETAVPVKKTKKKPATIKLTPVGFSVTGTTANTVTLKPAGNPFAKKAGQIVISTAVESAAGAFLASSETLAIAKGGKRITLG